MRVEDRADLAQRVTCDGRDIRFGAAGERKLSSARAASAPLALLIVDADHFKRYNDRFGHAVGDTVLKGLARCLAESVHRPGDLVARLGGEEFAILLPETDRGGALRIADKVHATVARLAVPAAGTGGRNQTRSAPSGEAPAVVPGLRLVGR